MLEAGELCLSLGFVANTGVESGVARGIRLVSPALYFLSKVQLCWWEAGLASDDFLNKEN